MTFGSKKYREIENPTSQQQGRRNLRAAVRERQVSHYAAVTVFFFAGDIYFTILAASKTIT